MARVYEISSDFPPIPKALAEAKPIRVSSTDPAEAVRQLVDQYSQPFWGRLTLVSKGASDVRLDHLKFRPDPSRGVVVTRLYHRDHDHLDLSAVRQLADDRGVDYLKSTSRVELLGHLDDEWDGQPSSVMVAFLTKTMIDGEVDRAHLRLENTKLEARLTDLTSRLLTLEARVSYVTGELVGLKSESFLRAPPPPPTSVVGHLMDL